MNDAENCRARQVTANVAAERQAITTVGGQIKDSYLRNVLKLAEHGLDDAVSMLAHAEKPTMPHDVSMWLDGAELFVSISAQQRQRVQKMLDRYGPNVMSIGG